MNERLPSYQECDDRPRIAEEGNGDGKMDYGTWPTDLYRRRDHLAFI